MNNVSKVERLRASREYQFGEKAGEMGSEVNKRLHQLVAQNRQVYGFDASRLSKNFHALSGSSYPPEAVAERKNELLRDIHDPTKIEAAVTAIDAAAEEIAEDLYEKFIDTEKETDNARKKVA